MRLMGLLMISALAVLPSVANAGTTEYFARERLVPGGSTSAATTPPPVTAPPVTTPSITCSLQAGFTIAGGSGFQNLGNAPSLAASNSMCANAMTSPGFCYATSSGSPVVFNVWMAPKGVFQNGTSQTVYAAQCTKS